MNTCRTRARQAGFTMIELIIVIIIIAILAAIAVPRYAAFDQQANANALTATAGNIASASEINFGSSRMGGASTAIAVGGTCQTVIDGILSGGLPAGYTTTGTVAAHATDTAVGTCVVTQTSTGNTATVNLILTA